jgi:hypothetical protein
LLIALYRAANIPARYVYGTVEISAEQAMNWVGGVTNADAAASLLSQGGIPTTSIVSGGKIVKFRIETVWVEAWLNYYPSRGAKHTPYASLTDAQAKGNQWVPMDASFKQYTYTNGLDIKANVPFNAQTLIDQSKVGATINESEGWVQNLNQTNIQSQLTAYQNQVKAYIDAQRPNATVGDVIGNKVIVAATPSMIAGTLPYTLKATANRYPALPDTLRHKIEFKFYASESAQQLDSPAFVVTRSLPGVANKRVSLTYDPATAADAKIISDAADSYQSNVPAYVVNVQPRLRIEGDIAASGGITKLGLRQSLTVNVASPWREQARSYPLTSGDYSVVAINAAGINSAQWTARMTGQSLATGTHPDFTAEMFHQVGMAWWAQKFAMNDIIAETNQITQYQLPSHALIGAPITARYFLGVARTASYKSRAIDAKEDVVSVVHRAQDAEKRRQYALTAGQVGSMLEGSIFEQAFLIGPGNAVSTVAALKAAADAGIRTYLVTQSNAGAALANLQIDAADKQEIQNAVAAGMRVTVPQREVVLGTFTGIGYIVEDPETGGAAYLISGGRNGGSSASHENVFPTPQIPYSPLIGILLGSNLRAANAKIAVENGMMVGLVFAPTLSAAGVAVGAGLAAGLALVLLLYLLLKKLLEDAIKNIRAREDEPKKRYRYYTDSGLLPAIVASNSIWATRGGPGGGTFGEGVYVTKIEDPINQGVGCPMTLDQRQRIVNGLQIPRPGSKTWIL